MYWNNNSDDTSDAADEIKSNMRCIETPDYYATVATHPDKE